MRADIATLIFAGACAEIFIDLEAATGVHGYLRASSTSALAAPGLLT